MSREFPDVLKSVLVRVKRTIKRLTKFFKSTDYSSEVLERQENLTTFNMKSTWKKTHHRLGLEEDNMASMSRDGQVAL